MGRHAKATPEAVVAAAERVLAGDPRRTPGSVTCAEVLAVTGGSRTTVLEHLREWRERRSARPGPSDGCAAAGRRADLPAAVETALAGMAATIDGLRAAIVAQIDEVRTDAARRSEQALAAERGRYEADRVRLLDELAARQSDLDALVSDARLDETAQDAAADRAEPLVRELEAVRADLRDALRRERDEAIRAARLEGELVHLRAEVERLRAAQMDPPRPGDACPGDAAADAAPAAPDLPEPDLPEPDQTADRPDGDLFAGTGTDTDGGVRHGAGGRFRGGRRSGP